MPNYAATITDLIAGDHRPIPWTITNVPTGGTVSKGWLTVKDIGTESSIDALATFQKIITGVLDTEQGHITSDGTGTGVAAGFFYILEEDSVLLTPLTPYSYDLQFQFTMTDATTRISTPERGTITAIQGVTTAVI